MAETSFIWDGDSGSGGAGDCGPYQGNDWDNIWRSLLTTDQQATEGIIKGLDSELAVSGATSPVSVAAGGAVVNGKPYLNTAAVTVAVPTPSASTRIDRIVLQADYAAQTVRIARVAGTEGGAAPALTQTDGVTWEISLAQASITTGGVITLTDERSYVHFGTAVSTDMIEDEAITAAKLAASAKPMKGTIVMWSGTLSGHFPVDPDTAAANQNWHICNGDTQNGVVTPDLRDRFVMAAGTTYAAGSSGGAATKNLAHTHNVGTLATGNESAHTHGPGTLATDTVADHNHSNPTITTLGTASTAGCASGTAVTALTNGGHQHPQGATGVAGSHDHDVDAGATAAGSAHNHTLSGASASGGSATQDIMPPYYALVFLCYVGT